MMIEKINEMLEFRKITDRIIEYLAERQRRVLQDNVEKINDSTLVVVYTHDCKEPTIGLIARYRETSIKRKIVVNGITIDVGWIDDEIDVIQAVTEELVK